MKALITVILLALAIGAEAMPLNPEVTQATIGKTICVPNWSKSVRPSVAYTNRIKLRLMAREGIQAADAALYELDHHLALSIGGAPRDPANLRLQPWGGPDGARAKDVVESEVHRRVCARRMTLAAARSCLWADWHRCLK